jgi:hypothetical protein
MNTENQVFPSAPMGRRVVMGTVVLSTAVLLYAGVHLVIVLTHGHPGAPLRPRLVTAFAPLLAVCVVAFTLLRQRFRGSDIAIENDGLVVGSRRYALAGALEVAADPAALRGAIKLWGNRGFGCFRGRFVSRRLGKLDVFVTDPEKAVVVRWPDRTVAVSPADTDLFIMLARKAAGLAPAGSAR